jgi:hypothetical protein
MIRIFTCNDIFLVDPTLLHILLVCTYSLHHIWSEIACELFSLRISMIVRNRMHWGWVTVHLG